MTGEKMTIYAPYPASIPTITVTPKGPEGLQRLRLSFKLVLDLGAP